jgi:thymidylate kinase
MPIIDKTKRLHLDFFEDLIKKSLEEPADLVIFDRLYLSQALRAKATVSDYKKIEESLLPFSPLTVYLKVDEASLASRIKSAMKHRDPAWVEYVAARSQASGGAVAYYTNQQRHQVEILKQSKIPYIIYDTTDHNYQEIAEKIASQIT